MSKFKVGDRVLDLFSTNPQWAKVEHIFKDSIGIRREYFNSYYVVNINDTNIITEEVYNSSLYQLMQEKT